MKTFTRASGLAAAVVATLPFVAAAQDGSVAPVAAPVPASSTVNAFPAIFGAASAFPSAPNSGFAALTFANPRNGVAGADTDAGLAVGYTYGSPIDGVAVTAGINITGIDPFGDSGALFLSVARAVSVTETSATFIGASAGSLLGWGDAENSPESYSVYVSHLTAFRAGGGEVPVQLTLGYSNQASRDGTRPTNVVGVNEDGFFAGVGLGVTENLAVSMSANEAAVNLGATATIPGVDGLSISAGVYDVTDNTNRQQFALTVGLNF